MTTPQIHADWKTTSGRRIAVRISALFVVLSAYVAAIAVLLDATRAWWLVALLALVAMLVGALAPAPIPSDIITGERPLRR